MAQTLLGSIFEKIFEVIGLAITSFIDIIKWILNTINDYFSRDYADVSHEPNLRDNVVHSRTATLIFSIICVPAWVFVLGVAMFLSIFEFDPLNYGASKAKLAQVLGITSTYVLFLEVPMVLLLYAGPGKVAVLIANVLNLSIGIGVLLCIAALFYIVVNDGFNLLQMIVIYIVCLLPILFVLCQWIASLFYQWNMSMVVIRRISVERAIEYLPIWLCKAVCYNLVDREALALTDTTQYGVLVTKVEDWAQHHRDETICWLTHSDELERRAVAHKVSERWAKRNRLAANIFIPRGQSDFDVLAHLAYQLSVAFPTARDAIVLAIQEELMPSAGWFFPIWIRDQREGVRLSSVSPPKDLEGIQNMLLDPIKSHSHSGLPQIIVIDGLNPKYQEDIMLLVDAIRDQEIPVLVFITSELPIFRQINGGEANVFKPLRSIHVGQRIVLDSWDTFNDLPRVYTRLTSIILRVIHSKGGSVGERDWKALENYFARTTSSDPTSTLLESQKTRALLLEMFDAQMLYHPKTREALEEDDMDLADVVNEILKSTYHREELLNLKDGDARYILDIIQKILDGPSSSTDATNYEQFRQGAHRLLVKLSEASGILSSSVLVKGVVGRSKMPFASGEAGDIYQGTHRGMLVALRKSRVFLKQSGVKYDKLFKTLCRRSLVWKHLNSPYIVPFIGLDPDSFPPALTVVSAWMSHGTILDQMERNGPFSEFVAERHLFEIAQGLEYLHSHGVVHGNLHGGNILINENWKACLSDFGLAAFSSIDLVPSISSRSGISRWTAPEILAFDQTVSESLRTEASDMYAFACVCCEIFSGGRAITMNEYKSGPLNSINNRRWQMPDPLWVLAQECWNEDPTQRPTVYQVVNSMVASGHIRDKQHEGNNQMYYLSDMSVENLADSNNIFGPLS